MTLEAILVHGSSLRNVNSLLTDYYIDILFIYEMTTYKKKFNKKHGLNQNESHSIQEISKLSGYQESGLRTIYDKG